MKKSLNIRTKSAFTYFFKNTFKHCGVGKCELSTDFFWVKNDYIDS